MEGSRAVSCSLQVLVCHLQQPHLEWFPGDSQLRRASVHSAGLCTAPLSQLHQLGSAPGHSSLIGIPPKGLDSRRVGVGGALDVQDGPHVPMQLLRLVIVPLEQLGGLQT